MIVASRLENTLNKSDILQLYLNSAYLGRGSWGIRDGFAQLFRQVGEEPTLAEGAMLAGLLKGPSFYDPDRNPGRAKERLAYVLGRMKDNGYITADQKDQALSRPQNSWPSSGRTATAASTSLTMSAAKRSPMALESLTASLATVRSTVKH